MGWTLSLVLFVPGIFAEEGQSLPKNWQKISLRKMKLKVIDGDTFDADLNRDGRFSKPKERIRLLYVDTPELSKSHKGKDRKFGLPAKDFLKSALSQGNGFLWIEASLTANLTPPQNRKRALRGNHGRLLAVLEVRRRNINLALIARGHSYFDTRFAWPKDYKTYARAEVHAFEKHLGIWSSRASRKRYLLRLRKEGKTVYSTRNPYFVTKIQKADSLDLSKNKGRFVRIRGKIKTIKKLRKGAQLIFLAHRRMKKGLPVISFENQRKRLALEQIRKGDLLQIEGFAELYKKRQWQIKLHRAVIHD